MTSLWRALREAGRRRGLALAALVALLALVAAAVAPHVTPRVEAHAALVRANPANNETLRRPPSRVILNFSEPLERELTQIEVTDRDDNRVDDGEMSFDDTDPAFASIGLQDIEPGLYYVRWTNVSQVDGHNLRGSYTFVVLNPDGTFPEGVSLDDAAGAETSGGNLLPKNIDSALKWIAMIALATVAGAALYSSFVMRPAAAFLDDEPREEIRAAGERWVVNLAHVLVPASFIATAFLVLLTVSRFETSTGLIDYLTTVRTGQYRLALLALLLIMLAGTDVVFLSRARVLRTGGLAVVVIAGFAAMFMYSMVSHGATGDGKFWSVASDFVHFAASAVWLGALAMLPPLLRWRRGSEGPERFLFLANSFDRFSLVAGVSVIVIFATGLFNALAEVPSWDALGSTTYGRVLLAKLALIVPLLAVAGLNAFVLSPRLVAAIDALYQEGGDREADRSASSRLAWLQRWLPRTVIAEIALVVAVFAAVAVLTQTATAEGEIASEKAQLQASTKFNQTAVEGGLSLTLEVTPNRVGINEYTLIVRREDGTLVDNLTQARLRFSYDDAPDAVAPSEVILNRFGPGDYRAAGAYFTQPGNWRTQLGIRRPDGDDVSRTFVLPVARAEERERRGDPDAFALPFATYQWNEVLGVALALAGVALVLYRRHLAWMSEAVRRAGMAAAAVLLIGGAVLAFGVDTHSEAIDARRGNPVKPSMESVAAGRDLFQNNCIACHGIDGRGDGPDAAALDPAPTDFRLHMPLHTDVQFYTFISDGKVGSAMPSFKDQFSETDMWNLVNFLRAEFSEAPTE